ncbi:ATP-binding cassette domain-containing protein [Microbacterium bovistercoris]|uniref:ATP-binding cassette domain-containing protein n=1 Tax=Microbacterium bovistercoris TaxID=2293570 RepID=A0A371NV56_9MICO|nr:ATP-binding cassette domain-containing protein [Microbacterium bovistercoris]REJ06387.1 ATP-binding cassette domain-containing protein [Microbacterium bovistercoris]
MQLTLRGVSHRFTDAAWLFRNLTFRFEAGTSYALTGPSGSGKSTLLALAAGWITPAEGNVESRGIDRTSWVFQNSHGMPRRTALDHVVLPMIAGGLTRAESESIAHGTLARFRLGGLASRPFRALSGGEAQRLMFARAVAANPQLILVDEPTAQLDAVTSKLVNSVIQELSDDGRILLVASHDADTVASCDVRLDLAAYAAED